MNPSVNSVLLGPTSSHVEHDLDVSESASALLVDTHPPPFWVRGSRADNSTGFDLSGEEDYSDEVEGITKKPSVIFPSVENKPILVNTTFAYEAGKNIAGATVNKLSWKER